MKHLDSECIFEVGIDDECECDECDDCEECLTINGKPVTKEEFDETLKKIQSMFDSITNQKNSTPTPASPPTEQEFKF